MRATEFDPAAMFDHVRIGASPGGYDIVGALAHELDGVTFAPLDASIADPALNPDVFRVRLARPRTVQQDSGMLVQRRYESRGYQAGATIEDPNLYTFAAYDAGRLAGTLGVRMDSAAGLKSEQLYGSEVAALRADGKQLTEFTRLAVEESVASKEVLAALFHTAVLYSHIVRGCSHVVIEVNPRHVAFYRRVLFFKPLGPERHLDRVGAPAVALVLEFSTLMRAIDDFFSKPDWQDRKASFFVHWFSPKDAAGIVDRLRRRHDAGWTGVDLPPTAAAGTPW
jgi:hypothetical protein